MSKPRIVMLATPCDFTSMIYHKVNGAFHIEHVIYEAPVSKTTFIKRRIKKLGYFTVLGQLLFQGVCAPILRKMGDKRITQILEANGYSRAPIPESKVLQVETVNSEHARELINTLNPDIILVNGTRIISAKTLSATTAKFINLHVGITPLYRGVHGAYWALANEQPEQCGVTIHLVDKGIDTGGILAQGHIFPEKMDTFATYPYLQVVEGTQQLVKVLQKAPELAFNPIAPPEGRSQLWYHPTIWQYLGAYVRLGVK